MKTHLSSKLCALLVISLATLLSGCGTPSAKDFGGRWRPINRYDDKPVEIPLAVPYTYYAAPMDGTLKTMLTRWTNDTGTKLSYRLRSDFTLPKAAADIHTSEVRDAMSQLSAIFAQQGVTVVVDGPEIVVEETSSIVPSAPAATGPSSTPDKQPPIAQATGKADVAAPQTR
ncbi:hypothetical protein [Luteibacter yeojuensis]|uniref:hypothetical protein n=1 Tax=Luteibacter yeojuensis TaxID=345309 RepID=UPI001877D694|nr:hypothetical protein [Luteibacter yeojuensis]